MIFCWQIWAYLPCRSTTRNGAFPSRWTALWTFAWIRRAASARRSGFDTISRDELAGMLYENSDEPYCEELAKAITDEIRKGNPMDTTTALREVIEKTLDFLPEKEKKDTIKKTCQRTFQALRIDVNREFEVLYEFMEKLPDALRPGGRAAILTFHSGEDKLVKKALKEGYKAGIYADYAKDVIRPSAQECVQNGRARSTKMRWAIKA